MKDACIYTVANKSSQEEFANLVYSIRTSGCNLDIVLIPFGGKPIDDARLLSQVEVFPVESFPREGLDFIAKLGSVLECSPGFLRRFLAFFGPYQKFIYTDNDIVALSNWKYFIEQLDSFDLVHADMEYSTLGKYNFKDPNVLESNFGVHAHQAAITAGHFAARKSDLFIVSLLKGLSWMSTHADSCCLHDQTLMHVASLCGRWKCLNLCKPPHHWLSSWAGDYMNTLDLIQKIQLGRSISHLHYSGGPIGSFEQPVDELLLSCLSSRQRLRKQMVCSIKSLSGLNLVHHAVAKVKRRLDSLLITFYRR
jgi:hypothetical protein